MKFQIVHLSQYPFQPIEDFGKARNYFIERLKPDEWILFVDDDEEPSQMLLDYLRTLEPDKPYYAIRTIGLENGHYRPDHNPNFPPRLISSNVRFVGKLHEIIYPRKPYGIIDFPIIHNHLGPHRYPTLWKHRIPIISRTVWVGKKLVETWRGR